MLRDGALTYLPTWIISDAPPQHERGRINGFGRAIAEKILCKRYEKPIITLLSHCLLKRRKDYYAVLAAASCALDISNWLLWFSHQVLEAQKQTLSYIDFILYKTRLMEKVLHLLNPRQEKVVLRILREGPEGFKGDLSAAKYITITGASVPTTTRDLNDLVFNGILQRRGMRKATRYFLTGNFSQDNGLC